MPARSELYFKYTNYEPMTNGILLLNKPLHLSSNQALQRAKRLIGAKKAGHTGSLDPLATGMLPLCFGEGTKFSGYLLDADKTYRTIANLGARTSTGDLEGEIFEKKEASFVTRELIEKTLVNFRGPLQQIPPMYSALKQQGRPLYELAREGKVVDRAARPIVIHELSLLNFKDGQMELRVRCSKGTYIRTLVEDIGAALGCGAHVALLHRESVSPFETAAMVSFDELEKNARDAVWLAEHLLPIDAGLKQLPKLIVGEEEKKILFFGQSLVLKNEMPAGLYRVYSADIFIGVVELVGFGLPVSVRRLCSSSLREA